MRHNSKEVVVVTQEDAKDFIREYDIVEGVGTYITSLFREKGQVVRMATKLEPTKVMTIKDTQ